MLFPQRTARNARVNPAFGLGLGLGSALFGTNGAPGVLLLDDSFGDTNGVLIPPHAPSVGPGWVALQGTFIIEGNKAQPNTDVDDDKIVMNAGWANVTVSAVVVPTSGNGGFSDPGLALRVTDNTHLWVVDLSVAATNNFTLYENVGAGYVSRATATVTAVSGTQYTVEIVCQGPTITGYFAGVQQWSYLNALSNVGATRFGLRVGKITAAPGTLCAWKLFTVMSNG